MNYLSKISFYIAKIRKRPLVIGSAWALLSRVASMVMQFGYFILLAHSLGAEELGKFVAVASLTTMAFPLADLGSSSMITKDVSRDNSNAKKALGSALLITLTFSTILIPILFILAQKILPDNITALSLILMFLTDILLLCVGNCMGSALYALYQYKKASQNSVIGMVIKFLAVTIFVFGQPIHNMQTWTIFYFTATLLGLVLIDIPTTIKMVGLPKPNIHCVRDYVFEGFYFSIGGLAESVNGSLDKTMMASLSTLEATGLYAAAWRFLDMAFLPLHSIMGVLYPKFFAEGASGISSALRFAQRIIPILCVYGIVALVTFISIGPIIPYLLGTQYKASIPVLIWLSPIVLIWSLQWMLADVLAGAGKQKTRTIINFLIMFSAVPLYYYLIPTYSWKGATFTVLVTVVLRLLFLGGLVMVLYQQEKQLKKD